MSFPAIISGLKHALLKFVLLLLVNTADMGEPSWQEMLRLRLVERNAKESAYSPIIEQCTSMLLGVLSRDSGYVLS